jgi:hypothetical protein
LTIAAAEEAHEDWDETDGVGEEARFLVVVAGTTGGHSGVPNGRFNDMMCSWEQTIRRKSSL